MSCFKQPCLNSTLILELFVHTSFGEKLWFTRRHNFSVGDPLVSHSAIVSKRPVKAVRVLLIGWNIKKFWEPPLTKWL